MIDKDCEVMLFVGVPMVPISWCKMQCPKTLQEEHRKVAKVQSCYTETVAS